MKDIIFLLDSLRQQDNFRSLKEVQIKQKQIRYTNKNYLNLSSNDYLHLAGSVEQRRFLEMVMSGDEYIMSNPSSRLITGNSHHYSHLEAKLASLYKKEDALVLSCGYMLNSGFLPALTTNKDLIIADKLSHASIIEALKLSSCDHLRFRHNDMKNLEAILQKSAGKYDNIYIVTESVFSMDGDCAPLKRIIDIKDKYDPKLYLDEAHAFGTFGERGLGLAEQLGVMDRVDYIAATMGKSLSSQGGFVICDTQTKELMVNRMRTLIFSTALPPISLMWSSFMLDLMVGANDKREHLRKISAMMHAAFEDNISESNIIPIITKENSKALQLAAHMEEKGYFTTAIRYPTVPKGGARLRLSLCADITCEETNDIIRDIKEGLEKI